MAPLLTGYPFCRHWYVNGPAPVADVVKTAPPVGERRRYAPTESFTPGEWIEHVKFGPGLVMRNAEPGKVRALFQDGERVLVAK